jgi:hypothetical protein
MCHRVLAIFPKGLLATGSKFIGFMGNKLSFKYFIIGFGEFPVSISLKNLKWLPIKRGSKGILLTVNASVERGLGSPVRF